ncbi:MAG: NAD(P)H-hydrate dehydratase, partial [Pseudobdellovibrionaceae bacterium]
MRLATREDIYKIDQLAVEEYGLSSSQLIERAGSALADSFVKVFFQQAWPRDSKIGVWCGPGNNGADGRVMAHLLREKDFSVEVLQGTAWNPQDFEIIIDALFGVGLNRPIEGELSTQILRLNKSQRKVIAVDIPSGLDANTGMILGAAVTAQWTFTIAPAKPGLFLQEGPAHCGRIQSLNIGFPTELVKKTADRVFLVGRASARKLLPSRTSTSNKTHFGHLLIVAGSAGMEGAALLAAEAAARMGCGYVSLCSPSPEIFKKSRPDFLRLSLDGFFKSDLKKYTAVVVGPGLGVNLQTSQILEYLLKHHRKVLVDADALTVLAQNPSWELPENWLLTPHAGELSRILGVPAKALEEDRLQSVQRAQKNKACLVLLKGFRTVLGAAKKIYIIGSGNVALAKAGSGDVLSGFIGSLMAQNLPTDKAAALGAYLHGWIADDWLRRGHSNRT